MGKKSIRWAGSDLSNIESKGSAVIKRNTPSIFCQTIHKDSHKTPEVFPSLKTISTPSLHAYFKVTNLPFTAATRQASCARA